MRDFSISIYRSLLLAMVEKEYTFQTFHQFIASPAKRVVILRHDVDARKGNSLRFARMQHELGITGTYYFRMVPQSFDKDVIAEIASLGHEIGYHYENMDMAKGEEEKAIRLFKDHLKVLRKIAPISTICMHGSPRSRYDNKDLWKHYDYNDYGIIGEPYFDIDFSSVFYLTDTGRRWDGHLYSVRDKVESDFNLEFHHTQEIIETLRIGKLPDQVMFNFHPQRWTDSIFWWVWEKYMQYLKNQIKWVLINQRESKALYKPILKKI